MTIEVISGTKSFEAKEGEKITGNYRGDELTATALPEGKGFDTLAHNPKHANLPLFLVVLFGTEVTKHYDPGTSLLMDNGVILRAK